MYIEISFSYVALKRSYGILFNYSIAIDNPLAASAILKLGPTKIFFILIPKSHKTDPEYCTLSHELKPICKCCLSQQIKITLHCSFCGALVFDSIYRTYLTHCLPDLFKTLLTGLI